MARKNPAADILPGSKWEGFIGDLRVMAVVEGYVVSRYKGCMPFVTHHTKFRSIYAPKEKR
jgi:hypothetical protein